MINIISNVNPTITVEITTNGVLLERKEISLSRNEAKRLYAQLQDTESIEWETSDEIMGLFEKTETDIFDENDYNFAIRFDERFAEELARSYSEELNGYQTY